VGAEPPQRGARQVGAAGDEEHRPKEHQPERVEGVARSAQR
jgi:hypothetical protein